MKREKVLVVKGALTALAILVAIGLIYSEDVDNTLQALLMLLLVGGMWINGSK